MTPRAAFGSTPIDDFLNDSTSSTDTGELLQRIGLFGSLFGVTLAAGLIVFLATVHRGRHREVTVLLRVIGSGGAVMLVGAVIEVAGVAAIGDHRLGGCPDGLDRVGTDDAAARRAADRARPVRPDGSDRG